MKIILKLSHGAGVQKEIFLCSDSEARKIKTEAEKHNKGNAHCRKHFNQNNNAPGSEHIEINIFDKWERVIWNAVEEDLEFLKKELLPIVMKLEKCNEFQAYEAIQFEIENNRK